MLGDFFLPVFSLWLCFGTVTVLAACGRVCLSVVLVARCVFFRCLGWGSCLHSLVSFSF